MLTGVRWIAGSILFLMFAWVAIFNALIIRVRIFEKKYSSQIPIAGGLFGALAFSTLPLRWLNELWWLPLILDLGSLPLLIHTFVFLIFYEKRGKLK